MIFAYHTLFYWYYSYVHQVSEGTGVPSCRYFQLLSVQTCHIWSVQRRPFEAVKIGTVSWFNHQYFSTNISSPCVFLVKTNQRTTDTLGLTC